jgi:F420-non-reducing hydrogenase iron-sulfur subunit
MSHKTNRTLLVYACNWNGWSCIEAATTAALSYPSSVRIVRVNCLSSIDAGLILNAFELGAEGVMLLGCEPGSCHFCNDSSNIVNQYEIAQNLLELLGVQKDRLSLALLPAFDGHQFVDHLNKLAMGINQIPVHKRSKIIGTKSL